MWALIVSFVALVLIATSYFMKHKSGFLLFQSLGIIFLMASYLFGGQYFAMVGLGIGLARTLTFYFFEQKNKTPSIFFPILFSGLSVAAYVVVNLVILKDAKYYDILYLIGLILYAFVFWIRDLEKVLYLTTIPTTLSVLYTIISRSALFAVLSYTFELGVNLVGIYKFQAQRKKKQVDEKK